MNIVYQFRVDKAYYWQLISRFNAQRPRMARVQVRYGIFAIVAAGSWLVLTRSTSPKAFVAAATVAVLAALAMGFLTRAVTVYRFSRRSDFGADVILTVSSTGVAASGERITGSTGWNAYPRCVRYPDGILLMRAGYVRWLPDSAIRAGTAEEATVLVKSKSAMREVG